MPDPQTTNILLSIPTRGSDVGMWDIAGLLNRILLRGRNETRAVDRGKQRDVGIRGVFLLGHWRMVQQPLGREWARESDQTTPYR
jgi:hypothetical protein